MQTGFSTANSIVPSISAITDLKGEPPYLQASRLIQTGNYEQAAPLIYEKPSDSDGWFYMNALMRFCEQGNSPASRAAMFYALDRNKHIFDMILDQDTTAKDSASGWFVSKALPAWTDTPGAFEWLSTFVAQAGEAEEDGEQTLTSEETSRLKRCQDLLERAPNAFRHGDLKDAKRLLRMALREADGIKRDTLQFYLALGAMIALIKETDASSDEITEILQRRTAATLNMPNSEIGVKAGNLQIFAGFYKDLAKYERAVEILAEAEKIMALSVEEGNPAVSILDLSTVAHELGFCLGEQRRYAEAEKCFRQSLDLIEQYLGEWHPELRSGLFYLTRCLHHLDAHEEEDRVRCRLFALGFDENKEEHAEHGPTCPWWISKCPA